MVALSHIKFVGILTNGSTVRFKSGRWGGARNKGEGHECGFNQKMFLNRNWLKLCLNQKHNITKLFLCTILFLDWNNTHCYVMG